MISILLAFSLAQATQSELILSEIKQELIKHFQLDPKSIEVKEEVEKEVIETRRVNTRLKNQLDANRLALQERDGLSTDRPLSGKEKIEQLLKKNREKIQQKKEEKPQSDWMDQKISEQNNWIKEKKELIERWEKDKLAFKKRLPTYKKNLTPFPDSDIELIQVKTKIKVMETKVVTLPPLENFSVVGDALNLEVKDQGQRPTCAAFAGIRAIEALATKQGLDSPLSEQYFYFASKPNCQNSPCSKQGSWVLPALAISAQSPEPNIPLVKDCPYVSKGMAGNETQLPLPSGCEKGKVKVEEFVALNGVDQAVVEIDNGHPVIAGFRLSDNFYENNGLVLLSEANKKGRDAHAEGHAVVLVGILKLPEQLHAKEGRYCLLTANSWGEGWGKGGHACLTENWAKAYQFPSNFVAIRRVSL